MKNLGFLLASTFLTAGWSARAQDINEAFNISNTHVLGTARSIGFGNVLGSVGGDFSAISENPAGLGVYRSSEISITPSMKTDASSSVYQGNTVTASNTLMNMNHFGVVFTNAPKGKRYERRAWKTVSFAFGMNKTADFNRDYVYSGKNTTSSMTQAFASDANLNPGNDSTPGTLAFLGYQSYLVNDTNGRFYTAVPFAGGINQQKAVQQRGGINEYVIALAGNYKEKILLGVTIGLPVVNYQVNSTYTESVSAGNANNPYNFSSFTYGNSLNVTGSGINLKLGAIWKFGDFFRLGASFHSPTYYNLSEDFTPYLTSFVGGNAYSVTNAQYPIGSHFDYSLVSPWKSILSGTFIIKSLGFVTADYEYEDFSTMRYAFPSGVDALSGASFQAEETDMNQKISSTYKAVSNFRVGGEIKLGKSFMVRAGAGYYGNPYQSSQPSVQRVDMSAGLGFHFHHFFTDLGVMHSTYKVTTQPYTIDYTGLAPGTPVAPSPQATVSYALNNMAWTIGFKF